MTEKNKAIKRELARILSKVTLSSGQVDTQGLVGAAQLEGLIDREYGNWINKIDIYRIIVEEVGKCLRNSRPDIVGLNGQLVNFVSQPEAIKIQDDFISRLSKIPEVVYFWIPAPPIPLFGSEFEINEHIKYVTVASDVAFDIVRKLIEKNQFPGGKLFDDLQREYGSHRNFFIVRGRGYLDASFSGSALENALSKSKSLLVAGAASYLMVSNIYPRRDTLYSEGLCFAGASTAINDIYRLGVLRYDLTCAILNYSYSGNVGLVDRIGREELLKRIVSFGRFLTDSNDEGGRVAIENCTEWAFQALANNDLTLRYVQTCIALEAILGDTAEDKKEAKNIMKGAGASSPSTVQLADRLAYLVGGKREDRRRIRSDFFKIYEMRSQLVHGKKKVFSLNSLDLLESAQKLLLNALDREIYLNVKGEGDLF